ncbi:MAG: hypothetical protein GC179_13955 [Anaerolineaceae bacterium]|nr:hypothetical protein [Anaerolineaceae bacterium]
MAIQPYQLTNDDLLYYMHIPKTAGTSFTQVLIDNVGSDAYYQPMTLRDFLEMPQELVEKIRFIAGHLVYDLSPVITRNLVYLTMLRNPVSRTISQYLQVQRVPHSMGEGKAKEESLLDFVKKPENRFVYANLQTRQLGLEATLPQIVEKVDPSAYEGDIAPYILWYSNERYDDAQLLELAQSRLEKMAFVGLSEHFDQSIDLLCKTFGWETPTSRTILNISSNSLEDVPQEAIDIIHENTRLDAALYETGKRLFEERYKQWFGDSLNQTSPGVIDLDTAAYNAKRVDILLARIESLETEHERVVKAFQEQVADLQKENERLSQIELSHAWRITQRIMNLRYKLIPKGSVIEKLYLKIRNRLV